MLLVLSAQRIESMAWRIVFKQNASKARSSSASGHTNTLRNVMLFELFSPKRCKHIAGFADATVFSRKLAGPCAL